MNDQQSNMPPWKRLDSAVAYSDDRYTLCKEDGVSYLLSGRKRYRLTCHPYEPCLYITDENGDRTAVHNAFDPADALESFYKRRQIRSITGREYSAQDFCRMVEYAAGMGNINIDDAERVFGDRINKCNPEKEPQKENKPSGSDKPPGVGAGRVIEDPCAADVLAQYPDIVIDYCIVKNEHIADGCSAHRHALVRACRKLFYDGREVIWRYDCGKAEGKQIGTAGLFAAPDRKRGVNYRGAFCYPPHGAWYTDEDFTRVNAALFPNGTAALEVYEWTTDWSEYFEDGREWWGVLCYTVYDPTLDRFVVILASATD